MRKVIYPLLILCFTANLAFSQKALPNITILELNGTEKALPSYLDDEKPLVISFWATWCKPCNNELSEISDVYDDWLDEVDFNFIAVSIDDSRSLSKVKSMVNGKEWPYIVLLDPNHDLKRALNVSTIPHTFIFNKDGKVVYEHKGYVPGNELELFEQLEKLNQ